MPIRIQPGRGVAGGFKTRPYEDMNNKRRYRIYNQVLGRVEYQY